jgi:AraC family transcriptional regulator
VSENIEPVDGVQRMQDYIEEHLDSHITLEDLAQAAGYSPWHATRLFKNLTGIAPSDYLRARRLSVAAMRLRDTRERVLDIALASGFDSHDGFTRAFADRFGLAPGQYRTQTPPISLFMPYGVRAAHLFARRGTDDVSGTDDESTMFVQPVTKPHRKLILLRGKDATDYWGYCEEVGCDVWGVLTSIKGALGEPLGMWLPDAFRTSGTSVYAQGVEMPLDYSGPVPGGMGLIELPECRYLVFQGETYDDEKFADAIGRAWRAIDRYQPETHGLKWAPDDGPRFQLAPLGERGYIEGRPVRTK